MRGAVRTGRALRGAAIGRCDASALEMLETIPAPVAEALSGALLAQLLDAVWLACQSAKAIGARDAISEGVLWDAAGQRLVETARAR